MSLRLIRLLLLAGVVALYFGAEWLVRGGASPAVRLGVTPLLVGLAVVACGTSTPELIVSATAAVQGQGAIAIGNVVGSNVFHIGVILGLTALVAPMRVQLLLLEVDTPVMVGVALLFLLFFRDGSIQRWESLVFLAVSALYTSVNVRLARRQASADVRQEFDDSVRKRARVLFGTAKRQDHALVLGPRSVHTNAWSLEDAQRRIDTLGAQLRQAGTPRLTVAGRESALYRPSSGTCRCREPRPDQQACQPRSSLGGNLGFTEAKDRIARFSGIRNRGPRSAHSMSRSSSSSGLRS